MMLNIKNLLLKGKRVLIRVDFNVPMTKAGTISDDSRIKAALPTIQFVQNAGGRVILMSHLGRPKGVTPSCTLEPCAIRLSELLKKPVRFVQDCIGPLAQKAVVDMHDGDILLLENLRFYDAEEKPALDPSFAQKLAALGDVYINDAFGTAHRAHASTAVIAQYFKGRAAPGFLILKEVEALGSSLLDPKRPFVALVGGAKISTKIGVLKSLLQKADTLLIGGAMAYTFMKAQGKKTGSSPVEEEMLSEATQVINEAMALKKTLALPVDLIIASEFADNAPSRVIDTQDGIPDGFQGMGIGPKTVQTWKPIFEKAKTIFWNGPVGVFEFPHFAKSTHDIAEIVAGCKNAFTVVGGGDSVAALEQAGLQSSVSHVSTGGGASLEFIELGTLPGLEALKQAAM